MLRRAYGIPSPGDVRNCLVALTEAENPLADVFQHRFDGEGSLAGHTVGNVILAALAQRLGDFQAAVETAARILGSRGRVVPSPLAPVQLVAALADGRVVHGEVQIAASRGRVRRVAFDRSAPASPAALEAIAAADLVVFGPGSLYSSILASLLADGTADALRSCRGVRALIVNLFTQPGESDGYTALDHVDAIQRHLGPIVDVAVVHGGSFPEELVSRYAAQGARPVTCDRDALASVGVTTLAADLAVPGAKARHDPAKLGPLLLALAGAA